MTENPASAPGGAEREPAQSTHPDAHTDGQWRTHIAAELHRLQLRLDPDAVVDSDGRTARPPGEDQPAPAWRRETPGEQRWQVSAAVALMILLQLGLPGDLTPVGRWTLPAIEIVIAAALIVANPRRIVRASPLLRGLSLALIALASLANALAMVLLITDLVRGANADDAAPLLATGANIWITNVIIFALWYWELDRGGPAARAAGTDPRPDFLFPQMADTSGTYRDWEPEFTDYAYVSFTNATAFSPTDTMPMSRWVKLAMMLQASVSLITAAMVIARAVNVLG